MRARRPLQGLIFSNGVVVGLALAVAEPGKEGQGDNDYTDTNSEFSALLHKSPQPVPSSGPKSYHTEELVPADGRMR
jgi:hypothetical protein